MMTDCPKEISVKLNEMLNDENETLENIEKYISENCLKYRLGTGILGKVFERKAEVKDGFSEKVSEEDLIKIHPSFKTENGSTWTRRNGSYLGKKYNIKKEYSERGLESISLDGYNDNPKNDLIRKDIREKKKKEKCCVLDIGTNIETDHKNAKKSEASVMSLKTQKPEDFQPMSKAVNDAKRQHCKECMESGKRFNAQVLGYCTGWISGDENTKECEGCYWYDPKAFNKKISEGFISK